MQKQRDLLRQQIVLASDAIKRAISGRGYAVFMSDAEAEFQVIVGGLRKKGELLSGIQRQFLEELLAQQRCICGAELVDG